MKILNPSSVKCNGKVTFSDACPESETEKSQGCFSFRYFQKTLEDL